MRAEFMEALHRDGRHALPNGWYFVRDDDEGPHKGCWFLSNPAGEWVAKFWDGPTAGLNDCASFLAALHTATRPEHG